MKSTLLALLTLNAITASAEDCTKFSTNAQVYSCLNAYAKESLAKGSVADKAFAERLQRLLGKYGLSPAEVKTRSLAESFNIIVDERSPKSDVDQSKRCFDFETKRGRFDSASALISKVQKQVDEAALFLAGIHASSWGHQVSLLFPIKEVSICSFGLMQERAVSFEQRSLHVGLSSAAIAAHELTQAWNSGNPIRSTELKLYNAIPFLGEKLRQLGHLMNKNPEGILRDKMADNWVILNPTGDLRTTALYTLAEAIFKIREGVSLVGKAELNTSQMYASMLDVVRTPGFTKADQDRLDRLNQDPGALTGLYNLWRQKIYSPQNILVVIENAIGEQVSRNSNLHLTLRQINAGVSVANDKNIIVRLEQLMKNAIPVSNFSDSPPSAGATVTLTRSRTEKRRDGSEVTTTSTITAQGMDAKDVTVNGDEVNAGVSINLIDNVVVAVQIPNISPETYRRVSLHQALTEYSVASEVGRP